MHVGDFHRNRDQLMASTEATLEHRFEAEEWDRLTTEQRRRRCHLMAEEAQALAKAAPAEIAESYLQIANDWLQLAREMQEVDSGHGKQGGRTSDMHSR